MTRLLIPLLALALLAAGCGGDDEDSGQTSAATGPQTEARTAPTDTGTETQEDEDGEREPEREDGDDDGESGGGDDRPEATREQLRQAVRSCQENVRNAPQLSDDAKDDLVELCEKAASGDPEELREVSREVCRRIIADTLPEGEQREQALRLCEQQTPQE